MRMCDNGLIRDMTTDEIAALPEPVEPELTDIEKLKIRQDATEDAILFLMDMNMGGAL